VVHYGNITRHMRSNIMCNTALVCEGIAKKQLIMENNSFATELHFKRNYYHKRVRKITRLLTLQLNILFYLADM